jgi:lysophospholipase L1-like esterase
MKAKLSGISILLSALILMSATTRKVHTCGDSTMAPYDPAATVTRGWGMYLQQFIDGLTTVNYARGGRDTRGFYNELWGSVKNNMQEGDYVIVQFAHNDEKNGGMDGQQLYDYYKNKGDEAAAAAVDLRGSVPTTTYKEYLKKYIEETRAKGAYPLLVGPACRSYFGSDGKIKRNGRHDLGDSFSVLTEQGPATGNKVGADDRSMDYAYQMKLVAEETGTPFIDLTTATKELYESYGDAKCHELLFDGQGSTHFNTTGALLVARLCAQLMKEQGILSSNIVLPTDISVSPATADLGEAYKGQTLQKEFTISGFGLSPETGSVTIEATEGISVSADRQAWGTSISIGYNAGTFVGTFYARLTLENSGETTGTITIRQGSKAIDVPVRATAVSMEGGTEVKAYWRLEKDSTCTIDGPATTLGEQMKGMYVQRYANPNAKTVWPEWTNYDATRKMQRNLLEGDNWPADEIDDNPGRYIQFGIMPNAGNTLKIDSIGLFVCGAGGNGMMCHIYYSTDNFETRHTLYAPTKMTANNPEAVQAQPVIALDEGQQLLLRIYPWYTGAATGKTICLSDVTIRGRAYEKTANAIEQRPADNPHVVRTASYDIGGRTLTGAARGLRIVRKEYADGTATTKKTIY